jgi:hypothetical protein
MPKAETPHTTSPSRRLLFTGLAGSAALAVLDPPGAAAHTVIAAPTDPLEAERVRLCNRIVAMAEEERHLYKTIKDDNARDVPLDAIGLKRRPIVDRLYELGNPVTLAGMAAFSRAALAEAPRDLDGHNTAVDMGLAEYLAFAVTEALAAAGGGAVT